MPYKRFEHNINRLLGDFGLSKIAIAVSGGSDSVALLYLAGIWAKKNDIELFVLSVDHNLRQQSKQEIEYIRDISSNLGLKFYSLSFDHQNNFSNLQERAREGRYDLMTDLCKKLDILVLLTAHHEDDYVENFCLRLERSSGIFGLSSSNINWRNNIQIVRPLFDIAKAALVDYLVQHNINWYEDESNLSTKYRRNIIRQKLSKEENYSKSDIILQQSNINELLEKKFKPELISAIAESVKISEYGFAFLDLDKFSKFSNEVKVQLINFLLVIISGQKQVARFYSVNPILKLITQEMDFKNTLHGCVIKRIQNKLLIYREFGKKLPENQILSDNHVTWDHRFYITTQNNIQDCVITYLTLEDYKKIKKQLNLEPLKNLSCKNHNAILFTLPVVKILEKVIAIPHISYYDNDMKTYNVSFAPNFISRFTHFC